MKWAAIIVTACAPPPQPLAPAPPAAAKLESFAQPIHFHGRNPVDRYAEPIDKPSTTPFDDAVIAASHAVADGALYRAAANLVEIAPPGSEATPLETIAVDHAFTSAGIVDPPLAAIALHATDPQAIVAALGTVPPGAHLGLAHDGDAVVAIVTVPGLAVTPFARNVPVDGDFPIAARLLAKHDHVEIDITWDDRSHQQLHPAMASHALSTTIGCQNRSGRGQVAISGVDGATSVVLARFPIWCGLSPPVDVVIDPLVDPTGELDMVQSAHRMFLRLQRDRVAAGLPALAWDDRAATAAQQRAEDLRDGVRAGEPPKFHRMGFQVPLVVQNLMHASSVDDAYAKIMSDMAHRKNAMSSEMTAGGIGIADDKDGVFVAQVFVSIPGTVDTTSAARILERQVEKLDPDIKPYPALAAVALEVAATIRAGGTRNDTILILKGHSIHGIENLYYNIVEARTLGEVDAKSLMTHPGIVNRVGIAVVQGHHRRLGDNALWVVSVVGLDVIPKRDLDDDSALRK